METSEPSTSAKDNSNTKPLNESNQCIESETERIDNKTGLSVDEFLSTGRTGRRNALPDILEQKSSHINTSDLPQELQKLNFNTDSTEHNGSSGNSSGSTSCDQNK